MVSFFGLKFGAEKKKEDESSPSQSPVRRFDPDTLDDGQFVPKDLARSGTGYAAAIYSTTGRPSSAHSNKFKPSRRKYSLNVPDTHTLASASTPEIPRPSTSHATTFSFSTSTAVWGNGSAPDLVGPPPVLGASARRPSLSSMREKTWVNPLDVHFSRDAIRTSALPAPLSQGLSPSPFAKKEESPPPLPEAPSIPARNPMRFAPPSPPRSAKTSLENEPCANEESPSVSTPTGDKRPVRRDSSPLRRDGSPMGRGASPFRRGASPFSREQSPFRRDESPLRQDSNREAKTPEPSRSGLGESESSFEPSSLPSPPLSVVRSHDGTASSTPVDASGESMAQNVRGKPDTLAMGVTRQRSLKVTVESIERTGSAPPCQRPGTSGGMEPKRTLSPAPLRLDTNAGPALKAVPRSATFDAPSRSDSPKLVAPRSATFDIAPRSTSPGPMGPSRAVRNGPPAAAVGAVGRPPVRNGPPPAAVGAVGRPPQPKRGDMPPPRQPPPTQSQPRQQPGQQPPPQQRPGQQPPLQQRPGQQPPPQQRPGQLPPPQQRPGQQSRPNMPPQQQPRPQMPPQQGQPRPQGPPQQVQPRPQGPPQQGQPRPQGPPQQGQPRPQPPMQQQPRPRMPPQQQPRQPPSQQPPRPRMPPQQQMRPPQQQPRPQMPPQQQPRQQMPPQQQPRPQMPPQQQPRPQMPPQQQPSSQPQSQRLPQPQPQPQPQLQPKPKSPVQAPPPIRTDFSDFFSRRESCDDSVCSEDRPESPDSPMLPVSGPLSTPRLPPPLAKLQELPKLQVEPESQASGPTADGGSAPAGGSTPKPSGDLAPQSAPLPTKATPSPIRWPLGVSEESDSEYDTQYGEDDDEDEEDEEDQKQKQGAPAPAPAAPAEIRWPLGGSVTDDSDDHHDSEDDDSDEEFDMQPPRLNGARCESPLSGMPMLLARSDSPFGARPPFSPHPWTGSRPGTPVRRAEAPVMASASSGLRSGPATPSQPPRAPGLRNPAIVGDDFGKGYI